jgi:PAS domain S-box-containing protein
MKSRSKAREGKPGDVRGATDDAASADSISADLISILDTVDLPIVALGHDFTVTRFNRAATALLGLTASDVGRSSRDIRLLADVKGFEGRCARVIADEAPCRLEIRDGDRRFLLRIAPYTRSDGRIGGVVLTFTNVTAFSASIEQAIYEREYTKAILNTVTEPLVVLDADLRAQTANRAFHEMFQVTREKTQGVPLYDLGNHNWDTPWLWTLLKEFISDNREFQAIEVEHDFPAIGRRTVLLDAGRLSREGNPEDMILLAFRDITERKQAEEAVRQSAAQFETLLNQAPLGVYLVDADFRIRNVNPTALQVFGDIPDLIGRDLDEVIHLLWTKEYADEIVRLFRHTLETGESYETSERAERRIDRDVTEYYEWRIDRIEMPDGGYGVVCYFRDISSQAQARRALAESEERYRSLFDLVPVCVYVCDSDGLIREYNQRAVDLWGRAPEKNSPEEKFCGSFKLFYPDGRFLPHEECAMSRALRGEALEADALEAIVERPDGLRKNVIAQPRALRNDRGEIIGAINCLYDITERKLAEAAAAQLATIVESSDDAIVSKDLNGVITSWNKGAEKLFGYTAADVIGKPVTILIPPGRGDEELYILERIKRGEGIDHYETVRRRKDGGEIDVSLTVSPIRDKSGKVVGASKISRDISDRKRVETEREELLRRESEARAEAENASRLKDEFLATVSHELRSPLNAILGWARMLGENRLDKNKSARAVEVIYRNAHAQNKLIGDLLEVSRIITGKLRLDLRLVGLIPIINAAIDAARPAAEAKNIRLISKLDPAAGLAAGDADRLQQIVWNLLSNAVKFTPGGGEITIQLKREAESITISVSDTGVGIDPEFLPYVFDRFRQFEGDTKRSHGGLGLGLAIVRHLVELHGGTVGAASPGKGRGATFIVTLPLAAPRKEASGAGRDRPAGAGEIQPDSVLALDYLRDLRVLLVDDEPDARDLLSLMLTDYGAEVKTCASAAEALQTLDDWRPDVLASDIGMPGEDGYDLLKKIRAREPERGGRIPAVALTAYASADDERRALAAGYQMHLPKPVEPDLLAAAVARLAGGESEN